MRLKAYLREDLMLPGLSAPDADGVLRTVAEHLAAQGVVPAAAEVEAALRAREEAHTTCMGHGMALPHATIPALDDTLLLVALAAEPVPFGPAGTDPVKVFFVLLSPPGREGDHIKLLARICRLMRHPDFMDALSEVTTGADAVELIRRVDEQHV